MATVRWSARAEGDLKLIHDFIARDAPSAAELMAARIAASAARLAEYPKSGRRVPETKREDIREVIVSPYRVVYLTSPSGAFIVTIHHSARLLRPEDLS